MTNRQANLIRGALFGYAIAAFAAFSVLDVIWVRAAPAFPNSAAGKIFVHDEHGSITYFSAFQSTSCALLFGSFFVAFLPAMAIGPKTNVRVRKLGCLPIAWAWDFADPDDVSKKGVPIGVVGALLIVFGFGPYFVAWLNSVGVVLSL